MAYTERPGAGQGGGGLESGDRVRLAVASVTGGGYHGGAGWRNLWQADAEDARRMLRAFSGRQHQVVTSVAVRQGDKVCLKTSVTDVTFRQLTDLDIQRYLDTGEPYDKA
ncbi:Maf family protein [Paludibacterium denitrificans]|uniref:Maf family protein n=1 Tax=Paludibacterium denitrificans TaxID=2675226 RepID=UPI0028AF27A8|nr:Maf family protein [Paludibacterium denitrificans]